MRSHPTPRASSKPSSERANAQESCEKRERGPSCTWRHSHSVMEWGPLHSREAPPPFNSMNLATAQKRRKIRFATHDLLSKECACLVFCTCLSEQQGGTFIHSLHAAMNGNLHLVQWIASRPHDYFELCASEINMHDQRSCLLTLTFH